MTIRTHVLAVLVAIGSAWVASHAQAAETIQLADGLTMQVPADWQRQQPRVNFIDYEFSIPSGKEGVTNGRLTVSRTGGSVEANIERWYGQFTQPGGKSTKETAKVEKKEIAGRTVHFVDISGTYKDARGPFAPAVDRPGYRMLAAIVETAQGNYFFKFYGPDSVISAHSEAFLKMVQGAQ